MRPDGDARAVLEGEAERARPGLQHILDVDRRANAERAVPVVPECEGLAVDHLPQPDLTILRQRGADRGGYCEQPRPPPYAEEALSCRLQGCRPGPSCRAPSPCPFPPPSRPGPALRASRRRWGP